MRRTTMAKRANHDNSSTVTVGLTQMACGPDFKTNLRNQLRLAEQAAKAGAKIICTQELFGSQYFCQVEDHRFVVACLERFLS